MENRKRLIIIVAVVVVIALGTALFIVGKNNKWFDGGREQENNGSIIDDGNIDNDINESNFSYVEQALPQAHSYTYSDSKDSFTDMDLNLLKLENKEKNVVYSPLSIKYALLMLKDGTNNNSKTQIENVLGDYSATNYKNGNGIYIANGLFIKDSFKNSINSSYINSIKSNYNAEVSYDTSAKNLNKWIKNKTNNILNNIFEDDLRYDFALFNSIAINLKWNNTIKPIEYEDALYVEFLNENVGYSIDPFSIYGYEVGSFNNKEVVSLDFGAVANRYDIVNTLGIDKIKQELIEQYKAWLVENPPRSCVDMILENSTIEEAVDKFSNDTEYFDGYIKDINKNYGYFDSSTDLYYYTDDQVNVFAKDLTKVGDIELQYVGIMPKEQNLTDFISNLTIESINNLTKSIKKIALDTFEDGYVTIFDGWVPEFIFDYKMNLKDDLINLGITDIFSSETADISGITPVPNEYMEAPLHFVKIEFTNEGIKAAALTELGGLGDDVVCYPFEYDFEVPVKRVKLNFDKPYMFIIRNKKNGETWFTGTVYEPSDYYDGITQYEE